MSTSYQRAKGARVSGRWKGQRFKGSNYIKYTTGSESDSFPKKVAYKGRFGSESKRMMNATNVPLRVSTSVIVEASEHVILRPPEDPVDVISEGEERMFRTSGCSGFEPQRDRC